MLYRRSNSSRDPINLLSYANPAPGAPSPEDPNPGAGYLRFRHSLQTPLAWALFEKYEFNNITWPIQPVFVQQDEEGLRQLGYYRRLDYLDQGRTQLEFVSYWYLCWVNWRDERVTIWSSLFWSPAEIESGFDCDPVELTLDNVVK